MPSRKFRTEGPILYDRYQFGYCAWVELAGSDVQIADDLGETYAGGYLPYSGEPDSPLHLFYMARSLRVAIDRHALDKKRRYDHRQWEAFGLRRDVLPKADFLQQHGAASADLARDWMQSRFGSAFLSPERYAYILSKPYLRDVITWKRDGALTAFALIVRGQWGAHYWYVFYRNGDPSQHPAGHGYLIDFIHWAQAERLPYAYLGTSYGQKSRYKSRGIDGIEFWDGNTWSRDRERLGHLREQDDARLPH
jgi:hypothetical protein